MDLPEEEKRGVPAYMVSFGDMITLLLTFFILLVALADTQEAGLVGQGRGPLIPHINAKGMPGIMAGRLHHDRLKYKRDLWWIPDQEGSPDELERVTKKLREELAVRFRPDEAAVRYARDRVQLRLPARIEYVDGKPVLHPSARSVLVAVADAVRGRPERRVRISGDVPGGNGLAMELLESATQGRMVFHHLHWLGVPAEQMSLWGWGATRPKLRSDPQARENRGITVEVLDAARRMRDEEVGDG